ncbi:hypothetical protein BPOR_0005g00430 [Botrytis porri]|uniref:Uncharacterized protein n=1 Tax=Botrytis porri TaxID=87229 RepID=A0A4Z1L677_9HELO|nr:hypothetical protein BPOR_0005g00430 [Botrytis porri]
MVCQAQKSQFRTLLSSLQFPISATSAPPPHMYECIRTPIISQYYGSKQGRYFYWVVLEMCEDRRAIESIYKCLLCCHGRFSVYW